MRDHPNRGSESKKVLNMEMAESLVVIVGAFPRRERN